MRLVPWLGVVAVVLLVVGPAVTVTTAALRDRADLPQTWLAEASRLVDLDTEANIPTWFSVILLAALSGAALVVALILRASGQRAWPLGVPAFVAGWLSLDELASLHEDLQLVADKLDVDSPGAFGWVVPGAVVALVVGLLMLRVAHEMSPRLRWRLVVAGAVYLTGALVVEVLSSPLYVPGAGAGAEPPQSVAYVLCNVAEEGLEMLGALLALRAVLALLRTTTSAEGVRIVLDPGEPALRQP